MQKPWAWCVFLFLCGHAAALEIEIVAGKPHLHEVVRAGQRYVALRIDDFQHATTPGSPEVPYRLLQIAVPRGMKTSWELVGKPARVDLPIAYDLAFAQRMPFHDGKRRLAVRNDAAYEKIYGDSPVEILEESFAATDKIATIKVWPVRYDARARRLSYYPNLKIRFRFVPGNYETPPVAGAAASIARYIAINPEATVQASLKATKIDLVIAHTSHQWGLLRYLDFKRERGRIVREHYVSGKTAQQIKDLIKQEYQSAAPPTGVLLVGNIDQIPAWQGSGDNRWTDAPYQNLDSGEIPDISLGRVPAHDFDELRFFVDKAIARELEPRNIDRILLTAGADTSLGCPANVTKVGDKFKPAASSIELVKKFKTQVGTQDIIDAYNANPNIIVYDGHGNRDGMTEVPLLISGLNKLTNSSFPIVLDIACLNANWTGSGASPRNFAESILLKEGRGVAGIMASGGSGYGHDFFQTIGSLMAEARQNLPNDDKMNEIGQVILAAKIKHGTQDRTYWNYYGDPATSVWESTCEFCF